MHTNHSTPQKTVIRSRFRSTTEDEPSDDEMPPPNRSDRPPPLPLCSRTSTILSKLVMISTIEIAMVTAVSRLSWGCRSGNRGQLTIPADPDEISGIQAGPADQRPVDVRLGHDRGHVVGLHRPAIQNTHTGGHFAAVNGGNAISDSAAHRLRVVRGGHLAGADRPYRLIGDHHSGHLRAAQA